MSGHQAARPVCPGRGRCSRRALVRASATGLVGLSTSGAGAGAAAAPSGARARSTILFFLCGGSSHVDMWDMKPEAPLEFRGDFRPVATTAPGLAICEHLPLTARQGHHLALVHGVTDAGLATGDHHAGWSGRRDPTTHPIEGQSSPIGRRSLPIVRKVWSGAWPVRLK